MQDETVRSWPDLLGRDAEQETLGGLLAAARAGGSSVLVLRGEAGIGKTALLDHLVARAAGCRVARAAGTESERELAHAGLHQICAPYLDRLDRLPPPQREALGTAFGLRTGGPPDRLLVGLAVLTLFRDLAGERPFVCVVDDAQSLDRPSASALAFTARRLRGEPVVMVFAARGFGEQDELAGLPELVVRGLATSDASVLLEHAVAGTLDPRVRERILAESQGNPRAVLGLPPGVSSAELAFVGIPRPRGVPWMRRLERGFVRQAATLPLPARRLLLLAAAEPVGDVPLLWRAAERIGLGPEAAAAAEGSGLVELRDRVRFRHPLVRPALYDAAPSIERRMVHEALAGVTDARADPDRHAWHRARAAAGPDDAVASELERSTDRALAHGDLDAAAAFLGEAAALTADPAQRVRRSLDGALANVRAGALDEARVLLSAARTGSLDESDLARLDLVQARIAHVERRGSEALPLLLAAARRLEPVDPGLARDAYLDALSAGILAGRHAPGSSVRDAARAALDAPEVAEPDRRDVLLEALGALFTQPRSAAAPGTLAVLRGLARDGWSLDETLLGSWPAAWAAASLWDDASWETLTRRHLEVTRATGARGALPLALRARTFVELLTGDLTAAGRLVEEAQIVDEATAAGRVAPCARAALAAVRGLDEAAPGLSEQIAELSARGDGIGVSILNWARAVLCNGYGRHEEAVRAADEAAAGPLGLAPGTWALAELVEAAALTGETSLARETLARLSASTRATGTDWGLGVEASCRALLSKGEAADALHREAVERLGHTKVVVAHARAQLLHGEFLRREGRRSEARAVLRTAHEALTRIGARAFADRARRELLAAGETVRGGTAAAAPHRLTGQEAHIARLAIEGMSNSEIGAAMFLSPRTVEWHLRRIFTKLGLSSRRQLRHALPDLPTTHSSR